MHPYLYELDQIHVTIQQNHREARNAEHLRITRQHQATSLVAVAMRLRASIGSMLITAGESLRHEPGAQPVLVSDPEPPAAPSTTTAIA